jgi:hypothetical protein
MIHVLPWSGFNVKDGCLHSAAGLVSVICTLCI